MQRQSSQRSRLVHQFSSIGVLPVINAQKGHSPSRDNLLQTLIIRLEKSIQFQNQRLKTIQHCLKDMLTDRFDKLLEVNVSIRDNTARMVERRVVRKMTKEMVSESEFSSQVRNNVIGLAIRNSANFKSVKHRSVEPSPEISQIIPEPKNQKQVAIKPQQPKNPPNPVPLSPQPRNPQPQPQNRQPQQPQQPKNQNPPDAPNPTPNPTQRLTLLQQAPGIVQIIKTLDNIVIETTQRKYKQYISKQIDTKELKAQFAWQLMEFCYHSTKKFQEDPKIFVEAFNHERKMELLHEIDSTLRSILEFMIKKYPPSKTKVLDTELAKMIEQKKNHTKLKYDILLNSGMSFMDDTGKSDFTQQIKIWINRLINQTKKVFPTFKQKVKEIFNGDQNSIDGETDIDYAIGSKISQNVEAYTEAELAQHGFRLKSPEILRILIKWIDELAAVFLNSTEKILDNRVGFKSSFKLSITLTQKRKQQLVENIKKIYTDFISPNGKINSDNLYAFFHAAFVYVTGPIVGYRDLPQKEVVICKVSQYINQLFEASTLKKLSVFLIGLNKIRKCYSQDSPESNLDLITFGVMDLVRCKCMGNKKQIKYIYNRLLASDYLQVIRVKNKLNESTRDILINFKIKDSFMIGQMQLALGDSQDDLNDHFCHYLYELQRSAFPVLMETANMVYYNDNRVAYFDKKHEVKFKRNSMLGKNFQSTISYKNGDLYCQFGHPQKERVMAYKKNDVPFCCQYCTSFVEAYKYSLEALCCPDCYNTLCPKCIIQSIPQIKYEYIHRYVKDSKKVASFIPKQQYIESMSFSSVKNITDKFNKALDKTPYIILMQFDNQTPQPRQFIFKRVKGRVIQCFQSLLPVSQPTYDDSWNALMTTAPTERMKRSDIKLCQKWMLGSTAYYQVEPLLDAAGIEEIIGIYDETRKQVLMIDIPETEQDIEERFEKKEIRKQVESENRKLEGNVELTGKRLENWEFLDKMRDEKLVTLNLWGNKIKSISELKRFKNLRELHMIENEISSIDELTDITELIHANFQNNKIAKLPIVKLQKLQSLNLSFNQLKDISNLAKFQAKSLRFLIFNNNKIPEVPVINLPELMFIIFNNNLITKISDLSKSCLPKLDAFRAQNNKIRGKLSKLNLPSLTQLQLGKNQIESIDEAFTEDGLSSIQIIGLSSNKIAKLPVIKLSHIAEISLKNNKIDELQNLKDWQTPSLTQLDLSSNQILSISTLPNTWLPNLSTLTLSNNNLTQLPSLPFPNLKHLDLSHNKLSSVSSLQHFKTYKLESLNLNSNRITSQIPILQMPNLTQLLIEDNDVGELVCLTEKQLVPLLIKVEVKGNCKLEKGVCMEKWKADNQREMREYCAKVGKKYEDVVNTNQ